MSLVLDTRAEVSELQQQCEILRKHVFEALRYSTTHMTDDDRTYCKASLREARTQMSRMRDKLARAMRSMGDE